MAESNPVFKPDATGFSFWYLEHLTEHSSNQLTVYDLGVGVQIAYSIHGMPLRGLGGYHLAVTSEKDADVAALRAEVDRLILRGAGHATPPQFGMMTKVVRASINKRELNYLLDAHQPVPADLQPIEQRVQALMARAAKFPLATLSMAAEITPTPIHVGDKLKVAIDFRNAGRFPVNLVSPAAFRAGNADSFRLNFWTRTGDSDEPFEYQWTLDLIGKELLVAEHTTLASKGQTPTIDPGATLRAWTTVRLPRCKPADYLVELVYIANPPSEPVTDHRIYGELHAEGVPVAVVKRHK